MTTPKQPITIHQFHFTASGADAITHHMVLIRQALKEKGIEGEIFVGENKAPEALRILPFEPSRMWNCDLLLVHHSHGNPLLEPVLGLELPKALIYHNITPPEFFRHDPHMARLSEQGRAQLSAFVGNVVAAFGDSRFNCSELELFGFQRAEVFPLLDLSETTPKPRSATGKARARKRHNLLFVGKVTPHKNQALLVQTLFYLQKSFPDQYELTLVGRQDPVYAEYLRLMVKGLRLEPYVHFRSQVSATELEECYTNADAYVCASLHEGFGVPLVEAMQRWLPIFALPVTGVRETLGKAGVRLVTRIPYKIAETIDATLSDGSAVETLLAGEEERLAEIAKVHRRDGIVSRCLDLVERIRHTSPVARPPEVYT